MRHSHLGIADLPGYQVRMVDFAPDGAAEANMGGNDAADHAIQLNMAVSMDW